MRRIRRTPLLLGSLLAMVAGSGVVTASEETAAMEDLECSVCHDDPDGRRLTDEGRYYGLMETLDGYQQVVDNFGSCTYCHVPDVGSNNLTREGLRFRWMMEDMKGLRAWLDENHPRPESEPSEESED